MNADFFKEVSWLKLACVTVYFAGFLCWSVFPDSSLVGLGFFYPLAGLLSAYRLYVDHLKPMRKWQVIVLWITLFIVLAMVKDHRLQFLDILGFALIFVSLLVYQRMAVGEASQLGEFEKVS